MRDDREIAAEALRRAEERRNKGEKKRRVAYGIAVCAACIALIVGLAFALPVPANLTAPRQDGLYSAALFAGGRAGGYVLIGVIAFALGALAAYFIFRKKK